MQDIFESAGGMIGAFLAAIFAIAGMGGIIHVARRQRRSALVYFAFAMIGAVAVTALFSGRDLSQPQLNKKVEHPAVSLANWIATGYFMLASFERIANRVFNPDRSYRVAVPLLLAFLLFWLTNVGSPMFLGFNSKIQHDFFYVLIIGTALLLCHPQDHDRALKATRDAVLCFWVLSLLAMLASRNLTLESNYAKSLFGGLPRYAGLASGAVTMGSITLTGLLCLWARPYERRGVQILAWSLGIGSFVLAQSKTAWLIAMFCAAIGIVYNYAGFLFGGLRDRRRLGHSMAAFSVVALGVVGLAGLVAFGNLAERLDAFENTKAGADMMTLTGRDAIWRVAMEEFHRHPLFGYGQKLFGEEYREMIGMTFATHGHSQFYDTAGRSGMVGLIGLAVLAVTLFVYAWRVRHATQGLSLMFFGVLAVRSFSEVPLSMWSTGTELLPVFLLLLLCLTPPTPKPRPVAVTPLEEPSFGHSSIFGGHPGPGLGLGTAGEPLGLPDAAAVPGHEGPPQALRY